MYTGSSIRWVPFIFLNYLKNRNNFVFDTIGNIHGQSWVNIAPIITPFPHAPSADITKELKDHNYSVLKMFDVADEFYQSIGLYSTKIAYDRSYIVQPENKSVLCQPTAWDYCNGADFR